MTSFVRKWTSLQFRNTIAFNHKFWHCQYYQYRTAIFLWNWITFRAMCLLSFVTYVFFYRFHASQKYIAKKNLCITDVFAFVIKVFICYFFLCYCFRLSFTGNTYNKLKLLIRLLHTCLFYRINRFAWILISKMQHIRLEREQIDEFSSKINIPAFCYLFSSIVEDLSINTVANIDEFFFGTSDKREMCKFYGKKCIYLDEIGVYWLSICLCYVINFNHVRQFFFAIGAIYEYSQILWSTNSYSIILYIQYISKIWDWYKKFTWKNMKWLMKNNLH